MLQRGWEEGLRSLLAGRVALHISSLLGLHEQPKPTPHPRGPKPSGDPWVQAASVALLVLEARRGTVSREEAVAGIAWWSSRIMPARLLLEASRRPLGPERLEQGGFKGLVAACAEYARRPGPGSLARMASAVAGELARPCARDPRLEADRARVEDVMKRLGLILGLALPALFVASLIYNPLLAIGSIAVAAAIWGVVRSAGERFRDLNIESSWAACTMKPGDVLNAILGRDMPSLLDLLGVSGGESSMKGFNP